MTGTWWETSAEATTTISESAQRWPMRRAGLRASSLRRLHLPYDEGRQERGGGETETEREKQRVRRKRPERSVKPQRERRGGRGKHNDVISIDSQGEQIFTPLCDCYHWTDRKEVGGLFTLNFNSIRHYKRRARNQVQNKRSSLNLSLRVLVYGTSWSC